MMQGAVSAREIVAGLGGHWMGIQGRCKCPICGANTFTVQQKGQVVLFYCWMKCPRDKMLEALREQGLWRGRPDDAGKLSEEDKAELRRRREAAERREREEAEARSEDAARMWHDRLRLGGTLAERYLRGRAITGRLPDSLGFSPGLRHAPTGLVFPVLLGAVQSGTHRVTGIQRIFLDPPTAGKALVTPNKMTFGILGDGAVRLGRAGRTLGIAEGIETALSAMQIYSLPVWAVLGAGRLGTLALPDAVEQVMIFADRGDVGEREAERAAESYEAAGRRAQVMLPDAGFKDFNDVLRGVHTIDTKTEAA